MNNQSLTPALCAAIWGWIRGGGVEMRGMGDDIELDLEHTKPRLDNAIDKTGQMDKTGKMLYESCFTCFWKHKVYICYLLEHMYSWLFTCFKPNTLCP